MLIPHAYAPPNGWFCLFFCMISWIKAIFWFVLCFPPHKVTMVDRSAADRACKDPNPIIDGRKANVNLAYLGAKPRVMQPGEFSLILTWSFVCFALFFWGRTMWSSCSSEWKLFILYFILFCRFCLRRSPNPPCVHPEALWVRNLWSPCLFLSYKKIIICLFSVKKILMAMDHKVLQ